ncbi:glucose PTS transporter subunit IIA [Microbacterium arborescens]
MTASTPPAPPHDRDAISSEILEAIGGAGNVRRAWHCITRLRFDLVDNGRADLDAIRRSGVAGAQFSGEQLQVIVGTDVAAQYASLSRLLDGAAAAAAPAPVEVPAAAASRFSPRRLVNLLFETLSGIFTPILPAIVGAGLLKGLVAIATQAGWLSAGSDPHQVFTLIADGAFVFLPFLVAASAARRFDTDLSLALSVPAALMYPTIVAGAGAIADGGPAGLDLYGLAIPFVDYANSVIPAILGVYALSKVHRLIDRIVPAVLKIVVTPVLTLLIVIPLTLIALAPLGHYAGVYVSDAAVWLMQNGGVFAGMLLGGLMPLIVITGMHYAFFPTTFQSLATRGYDVILLPFNLVANLATAGATIAVAIRVRRMRALALSTGFTAFLGITEPAIYGVTLRLKRPFFFTLAGGAVGGAYAGLFALKTYGFAVPGLASLPLYVAPDGSANLMHAGIAIALSFTVAFVLTLLFVEPRRRTPGTEGAEAGAASSRRAPNSLPRSGGAWDATIAVAPLAGRVMPLSAVPDPTFADGLMGPGVAIAPRGTEVVAPFDGTVEAIAATRHAIGLRDERGTEILIHVGIDTVTLPEGAFAVHVEQGQRVLAGDRLLSFDTAVIEAAGLSSITPVVVTNAGSAGDMSPLVEPNGTDVDAGEPLFAVTPARRDLPATQTHSREQGEN